jgi:hypothetical protein
MRSPEVILNIPYGSDVKTVKRAYVSTLRQFDPQNEPERFAELKAAYNYMLLEDSTQGDDIYELDGPLDNIVYDIHSQIYQENKRGVAVKNAQKILKEFPDSIWANKMMYAACMARGWYKKAAPYEEMLLKAGCTHPDFLLAKLNYLQFKDPSYKVSKEIKAYFSKRNYWPERTRKLAITLLCKWLKEAYLDHNLPELENIADVAISMLQNHQISSYKILNQLYTSFGASAVKHTFSYSLLEKSSTLAKLYMQEYPETKEEIFKVENMQNGLSHLQDFTVTMHTYDPKYHREPFLEFLLCVQAQKYMTDRSELYKLSDTLACAKADALLYFIERKKDFLAYCAYIKKYYFLLYPLVEEFEATLKSSMILSPLKEEQEKIVRSHFMDYDFLYLDLNPAAKPRLFKTDRTVIKKEASSKKIKIGRNDPCPCGSGKKYKNCCGRK